MPAARLRQKEESMSVTLHTNLGDLKCEIHCDLAPRASEVRNLLGVSIFYSLLDCRTFWLYVPADSTITQISTETLKVLWFKAEILPVCDNLIPNRTRFHKK